MDSATLSRWQPQFLGILRIVAALLFFSHGVQKILGFPAGLSPEVMSLPWIAGIMELVGGALLILGLFTRPVAFLLSGQMAVAYWMAHAPQSPLPIVNKGEGAILYCFIFLYLVFAGAGAFSLDGAMRRGGPAGRL